MRPLASTIAFCAVMLIPAGAFAAGQAGGRDQPPSLDFGPGHPGMALGPAGPRPAFFRPRPYDLAATLSAMETAIGIRAHQLNAWRDFTDAFQAVMQLPQPPAEGAPGAGPFALPVALPGAIGADLAERGKRAEALIAAIGKLRGVLSPDQIERAKRAEPPAPPRLAPPGPDSPRSIPPGQRGPAFAPR